MTPVEEFVHPGYSIDPEISSENLRENHVVSKQTMITHVDVWNIHWCVRTVEGRKWAQTIDGQPGAVCVRPKRSLAVPQVHTILDNNAIIELIDDKVSGEWCYGHVLRIGSLLVQTGRKAEYILTDGWMVEWWSLTSWMFYFSRQRTKSNL